MSDISKESPAKASKPKSSVNWPVWAAAGILVVFVVGVWVNNLPGVARDRQCGSDCRCREEVTLKLEALRGPAGCRHQRPERLSAAFNRAH